MDGVTVQQGRWRSAEKAQVFVADVFIRKDSVSVEKILCTKLLLYVRNKNQEGCRIIVFNVDRLDKSTVCTKQRYSRF